MVACLTTVTFPTVTVTVSNPKTARNFAKILGYSPEQFGRLCLQDMMNREELDLIASVVKGA